MTQQTASTATQPTVGRRVRWPEPRKAELETFEVSSPRAGQIVVRTHFSVLSRGTERDYLTAAPNTARQFPLVPGYSSAGLVTAVGDGVTSFQPDDPVICYHGGHTSHAVLDANQVFSLAENRVDLQEAALIVLASMSLQALRKGRLELGERVVVWGAGLLGLLAAQLAICAGASPVTVIDPDPRRRDLALQCGADTVLDPPTWATEIERHAAEVVVEASGHPSALPSAIKSARRGGRVALLGCTREADVPIDYYQDVHKRGITILGAHNSARPDHDSSRGYWTRSDDYLALARLISAGRLSLAPLIEQIVPATDAPGEYERLLSGQAYQAAGAVLFDWR